MTTYMVIEMNTTMGIIFIVIYLNYFQSSITVRMTVFVKRGLTVNFSCPFLAVTTPITWRGPPNLTIYSINKKVNRQIDKLNRIDVNGNSTMQQYNLSIFNFTTIDTGVYRCDTLINKHSMKHEIEVNIADPPTNMKIINETKEGLILGQENSLLNLICTVDSGKPQTTLAFKLENTSIMSNSSEYVQHLFVARRFHHLKHLKCIAENAFYRVAKDVQLYVYLSPEVHVYAEPLANVEEGNDIILVCWYESNIKETVLIWKRNNVPVLNTQNRNLTLTNVSKEDTGIYSCAVENRIGIGTDMINITVLYKPRVTNLSNTFEIESNFGKPSFISFTVASGTKPYIAWTYDLGGKIGYWNVQDIGEEKYNVSSTIVPYDKSHLGHYAVRVRNTIGSISLIIELVGFKVNVFPSKLVCNMSNVIELTCNVSLYTTLNLSNIWVHSYDGTEIRSLQGSVYKRSSTLRIPFCDYRDAGTYTCMWMSTTLMHSVSSKIYVQSHPVLTLAKTFKQHGKTTLKVRFYSFPPPMEVVWFYKDKPILETQVHVGKNMQETRVKLLIKTKSVIAKGYVTYHQINGTNSTSVELYSCQVRNSMGNLDVSFHELNSTKNITSNIGKTDGISYWLISVLIGSFFTVVVIIVTISLLLNWYFQGKSRKQDSQNDIQREQEIGSRNSNQSSINHFYEEVDSAYYHTVEWRNYSVEESLTGNNDLTVNTDASIGSRDSDKTRDFTDQSQNDDAVNSYMELF